MKLSASPPALHPTGNLLHGKQNPAEWRTVRPATHQKAENPLFFTFSILIKLHGSVGGIVRNALIDFKPSLQGLLFLLCHPGNMRSKSDVNTCERQQDDDSDIYRYLVMRTDEEKQWKKRNSLLSLQAPVVPLDPLWTAGKEQEVTKDHQSRTLNQQGKGSVDILMHTVHNDISDAHGSI